MAGSDNHLAFKRVPQAEARTLPAYSEPRPDSRFRGLKECEAAMSDEVAKNPGKKERGGGASGVDAMSGREQV